MKENKFVKTQCTILRDAIKNMENATTKMDLIMAYDMCRGYAYYSYYYTEKMSRDMFTYFSRKLTYWYGYHMLRLESEV